MISEVGPPSAGLDIETYVIAKADPVTLHYAARRATPGYEGLIRIKKENPSLYDNLTLEPQPELKLGEDIMVKQFELARPRRAVITALSALVLGAGLGTLTYEAKQSVPPNDEPPIVEAVGAGALGGYVGGTAGFFCGLAMSHRLARRPAQRIVQKTEQESHE